MKKPIHYALNRKANTAEVLNAPLFEHWEMVSAAFHVGILMSDGRSADGIGRCKSIEEFQRRAAHGKTRILP